MGTRTYPGKGVWATVSTDSFVSPGTKQTKAVKALKGTTKVAITIDKLPDEKWQDITNTCSHRIDSLAQLLEGTFPESLSGTFFHKQYGLFPTPQEIHLSCNCPD